MRLQFEFESSLESNKGLSFTCSMPIVMWELCMCSSYSSTATRKVELYKHKKISITNGTKVDVFVEQ